MNPCRCDLCRAVVQLAVVAAQKDKLRKATLTIVEKKAA